MDGWADLDTTHSTTLCGDIHTTRGMIGTGMAAIGTTTLHSGDGVTTHTTDQYGIDLAADIM